MPLDDTRFVRARPPDPKEVQPTIVDVVSSRAAAARSTNPSFGKTSLGTMKTVEMHEKEGMGQLTSDLTVHSLLEEVLEELRAIRIQLNNPTRPTPDLGRRTK